MDSEYTASTAPKKTVFLSICSNESDVASRNSGISISEKFLPLAKDMKSFEIVVRSKSKTDSLQESMKHSKVTRTNDDAWDFQNSCNANVTIFKADKPNIYYNQYNNNNNNNNNNSNISHNHTESALNNPDLQDKRGNSGYDRTDNFVEQCSSSSTLDEFSKTSPQSSFVHRKLDQKNIFRHIEDVHNYSKPNYFFSEQEFGESSIPRNEEDKREYINRFEDTVLENDVERDESHTLEHTNSVLVKSAGDADWSRSFADVLDPPQSPSTAIQMQVRNDNATPDHHARRPMNAFLIFCKRHRAIVKDRYKSLENRAITKILGDWWASLDGSEKKCYTGLAQQNKEVFFSANPDFKWYKLPAPPLRTLHTRPSKLDPTQTHNACLNDPSKSHLFKLADEADMGELSFLMCDTVTGENALQKTLGESTCCLNAQMPLKSEYDSNTWKRKLLSDQSRSASSEEEAASKKSSRSCKGKLYEKLINSGQIIATSKKSKSNKLGFPKSGMADMQTNPNASSEVHTTFGGDPFKKMKTTVILANQNICENASSQMRNSIRFDLESKIKELPILSLDAYLQSKHNTKKKKKINAKKRNMVQAIQAGEGVNQSASQKSDNIQTTQVVGSQKRKARKESITRRDVSAIQNEVTSVLAYDDFTLTFPINKTSLERKNEVNECKTLYTLESPFMADNSDNITSTSDLLILAEAAAKRTEPSIE